MKYKKIAKGYTPNWSEEVLVIKKVKNTVMRIDVISDLKKSYGFRVEKVIKGKGDELYVKWKSYNSSFNSCINTKDNINE